MFSPKCRVAPFTGAWIEISLVRASTLSWATSHPSRVRGLKYMQHLFYSYIIRVAPFTGAWIEMPHTCLMASVMLTSHPSRVRGLKCKRKEEIRTMLQGRTLHGCVD